MITESVRVYALLGPESGDKSAFLKEIRANLKKQFDQEIEIHRFYPFETLNGEIFEILQNNSLFSDHRLVILSQAENIPQQLTGPLLEYMKDPVESATLVLISEDFRLKGKLDSAVSKEGKKIFYEMYDNQKPRWVKNLFSSYHLSIDDAAVSLLLELVEHDTAEIRSSVQQLIQFIIPSGTAHVTEDDIERYIQHTRVESVFSLFEYLSMNSYEMTLQVFHALMRDQTGGAIALISGLLWTFRRLLSIEEMLEENNDWEASASAAMVMGKKTPLRRKKDHQIYREASRRYPIEDTRRIIALLGRYDITVREYPKELELLLMEQMISTIFINRGVESRPLSYLSMATDSKF
ncbi:MAG: DNA polymerase III subunit delta [Sphaerochaetaceae bacterium]|nr:DNA polymerase III subunit delta [Sphaerochaetaceae bacterium]